MVTKYAIESMNATALHNLAAHGTRAEAETLLNNSSNIDINARDDWGATPLHYAASKANIPLVELLLERGANVNARMKNGETPLRQAQDVIRRMSHHSSLGAPGHEAVSAMLRRLGGIE